MINNYISQKVNLKIFTILPNMIYQLVWGLQRYAFGKFSMKYRKNISKMCAVND